MFHFNKKDWNQATKITNKTKYNFNPVVVTLESRPPVLAFLNRTEIIMQHNHLYSGIIVKCGRIKAKWFFMVVLTEFGSILNSVKCNKTVIVIVQAIHVNV